MRKETILNKCPVCGNELEYVALYQYSNVYRILKNGKISKNRKFRRDEGSMGSLFICANGRSDNFLNFTGLCCEDECEDGESDMFAESVSDLSNN